MNELPKYLMCACGRVHAPNCPALLALREKDAEIAKLERALSDSECKRTEAESEVARLERGRLDRNAVSMRYLNSRDAALARVAELEERVRELEVAVQSAIDCGMIPVSSASEGGAVCYSEQVRVADLLRAALAAGKEVKP